MRDDYVSNQLAREAGPVRQWELASHATYMHQTLKAIADLTVNDSTDHAQLSALCIAMAKTALARIK